MDEIFTPTARALLALLMPLPPDTAFAPNTFQ